ncbi:hypothetical protein [Marinoscillum furvescens]|uniref:Uncharacterized protein n=1 Tax=Marinoscillum furvescens DSM 4134 TaxID=1122208 RepID=A0A3D9L135_MARFU|nr:hypothetical protein [Marinoscillum furvescens]RED95288.1 hypothetical protein C7460_11865 [Marinoscillum furvescens DSM 4134]
MKFILVLILNLSATILFGQSVVEWAPTFELELTDFQSPQTEINESFKSYSLYSGANIDFSFHMTTGQFMFTKNFNSKVATTFNRSAAVLTAPDSLTAHQLLNFGKYSFDLTELYARRFRKELNECKGAFSDVSFYKPIYEEIQANMNEEHARVLKQTDLGRKSDLLQMEHQQVLSEIEILSDYCKTCKPPKKKKQK